MHIHVVTTGSYSEALVILIIYMLPWKYGVDVLNSDKEHLRERLNSLYDVEAIFSDFDSDGRNSVFAEKLSISLSIVVLPSVRFCTSGQAKVNGVAEESATAVTCRTDDC